MSCVCVLFNSNVMDMATQGERERETSVGSGLKLGQLWQRTGLVEMYMLRLSYTSMQYATHSKALNCLNMFLRIAK